ncbi:MAG: ribose 5-phosphate isomerase B [Candidatus Sumerlaeota bacterium]|nr:ribose 5-phosphate isomerase B [Candidatus Sumerlaeota bacterium]
MKVAFANDHAGFPAREAILRAVRELGHDVVDFGANSAEPVDYPDYAEKASSAVARGEADCAILACGTGQGMAMAANKISGIRAARCLTPRDAQLARSHNDANVLALAAWAGEYERPADYAGIVKTWFETQFAGGRHCQRVQKIAEIERRRERN